MYDALLDLRDTMRSLRRDPVYAAAVIATLALTLGASTAVFSILNGVVLRPLAYREAQRLVSLREVEASGSHRYSSVPANARHFEEWRRQSTTFAAIADMDWRTTSLTGTGEPAQLTIVRASGTIFDVLEMPLALGRPLTREDEQPDRPPVTVISERLWADRLGRDPNVVGRTLVLGGTQYTVVGVLQSGAELPTFDVLGETASLSSAFSAVVPFRLNFANIGWMGQFNYPVIARLKPGVTLDQARAELDLLQRSVAEIATRETHEPVVLRGWITPLEESIVGRARLGLLFLLGAIGGVLLIACANLANLSLTRTVGRLRDAAVRSALGASRGRLVAGVVLEQLLLALVGGALGLLVARECLTLFVRTAPIDLPRVNAVAIDARVLLFAAAVTIVAGLSVALLPAWRGPRRYAEHVARRRTRHDGSRRPAPSRDAARLSGRALGDTARRDRSFRDQLRSTAPGPDRLLARPRRRHGDRAGRATVSRREGARGTLRSDSHGDARFVRHHVGGVDVGAAADRRDMGRPHRPDRRHSAPHRRR
jgi:ABC-type antimicrobial peptide transport system, permease component